MGGMTNDLLAVSELAAKPDTQWKVALDKIASRYREAATNLVSGALADKLDSAFAADVVNLETQLQTLHLSPVPTQLAADQIAGYGEIWSARLLAALLEERLGSDRAGTWIDARQVLTVRQGDLGPTVLWDETRDKMASVLAADFAGIAVITGFIAADEQGIPTTLGRNGSDFSAAIFSALTGAGELDIWTDVDGVMSADPRRVPDAQIIHSLSYNEAMELAYFGAKVIHPQTLGPAIDNGVAVVIRNSFRPEMPGSRISTVTSEDNQIKGITAIGRMALLNLEGTGMIGVPGTADRLFASLKEAGVSVTLISQASSEHSICIAVPAELAELARATVSAAFAEELAGGQIQNIDVSGGQSIIAVVGDGMAGSPGVAARFFTNMARSGINVRAIAQGSSERNISAVVDSSDVTRALRAVHSGFYLSAKTISIGLIGVGVVGSTLLDQIQQQTARLVDSFGLDLRFRGIARTRHMMLGERRIDLNDWRAQLEASTTEVDFDSFERHVNAEHLPHAVIIDCTADEGVANRYAGWLRKGIHVITPNKKAFSGRMSNYESIRSAAKEGRSHYFYETTVGAALPIIKTIRDLVDTGDRVHSVKGILSGTLAYLFNVYDGSRPFSEIVSEARNSGYTEPDPRDDLSGMDVARKLTILARELGQDIGIGDFPVQNLIPEALRDCSVDAFLAGLADYDDEIGAEYSAAHERGQSLRYIATLDADGSATVGLERVAADDAFANMQLTDNLVQLTTDRYASNPLVIQGPGAGPDVTAGGVFGDLLKLATYLGDGI